MNDEYRLLPPSGMELYFLSHMRRTRSFCTVFLANTGNLSRQHSPFLLPLVLWRHGVSRPSQSIFKSLLDSTLYVIGHMDQVVSANYRNKFFQSFEFQSFVIGSLKSLIDEGKDSCNYIAFIVEMLSVLNAFRNSETPLTCIIIQPS